MAAYSTPAHSWTKRNCRMGHLGGIWGEVGDKMRTEARALGARVELHYLSAPLQELFSRIRKRDMEDPPIKWEDVQERGQIFEPPTPAEIALFDPPFQTIS